MGKLLDRFFGANRKARRAKRKDSPIPQEVKKSLSPTMLPGTTAKGPDGKTYITTGDASRPIAVAKRKRLPKTRKSFPHPR